MKIDLGRWSLEDLGRLMGESSGLTDPGERVAFISGHLLHTPYEESTLTGDMNHDEEFVINLARVDCFTFLEYVEAMRLSSSFPEFQERLPGVRYRDARVSYESRNHFFTDWREYHSGRVYDVTGQTGGSRAIKVLKNLNEKDDGTLFLQGIGITPREIGYVPSGDIDRSVMQKLRTGDYAGVYSESPGLDVSHTGIIVKHGNTAVFRHASSASATRAVVDEDFQNYLSDKPGIIVLRPRNV